VSTLGWYTFCSYSFVLFQRYHRLKDQNYCCNTLAICQINQFGGVFFSFFFAIETISNSFSFYTLAKLHPIFFFKKLPSSQLEQAFLCNRLHSQRRLRLGKFWYSLKSITSLPMLVFEPTNRQYCCHRHGLTVYNRVAFHSEQNQSYCFLNNRPWIQIIVLAEGCNFRKAFLYCFSGQGLKSITAWLLLCTLLVRLPTVESFSLLAGINHSW